MYRTRIFIPFIVLGMILLAISLACASSTPTTEPPQVAEEESVEPTEPPEISEETEVIKTEEETSVPESTATKAPTNTPEPTATSTPLPIGMSRENPLPSSETVTLPDWEIQIVEVKRGEEAWADIKNANMFNEPAPEGMEYLLVKIHMKSTHADDEEHSVSGCDFDVTGDKLINYSCSSLSIVEPEPQLDATLFAGGETEGWAAYGIGESENNLILIFNETFSFDETNIRYIAIDDGASISIPSDLKTIKPNNIGLERSKPAPIGETVITDEWEITILEVIRGEEAWQMAKEENQYNDPPDEGMEYIAIKILARYIGTTEGYANIDGSYFNTTGSAGVLYDIPSIVDPEPALDLYLFPGGEGEGWIITQAAIDETDLILVFEPWFNLSEENKRFLSIENE